MGSHGVIYNCIYILYSCPSPENIITAVCVLFSSTTMIGKWLQHQCSWKQILNVMLITPHRIHGTDIFTDIKCWYYVDTYWQISIDFPEIAGDFPSKKLHLVGVFRSCFWSRLNLTRSGCVDARLGGGCPHPSQAMSTTCWGNLICMVVEPAPSEKNARQKWVHLPQRKDEH